MDPVTVRLNGRAYTFDGQRWYGADDYTQPPLSITNQLMSLLPPGEELRVRMRGKRSGLIELRHFLGYHSPEVMGCTAEECDGLGFLTSKDFGNPVGDVLWFVGKARGGRNYFLRSWYIIEAVTVSDHPDFDRAFVGSKARAGLFEPMPELTDLRWFQEFFPTTTCAHGFGMDVIPSPVVADFKKLAAKVGPAFEY
jgi:hypothetical protein